MSSYTRKSSGLSFVGRAAGHSKADFSAIHSKEYAKPTDSASPIPAGMLGEKQQAAGPGLRPGTQQRGWNRW